jgi:hypothetical protein
MRSNSSWHHYRVYGISLRSQVPLHYPESDNPASYEAEIVSVPRSSFPEFLNGISPETSKWFQHLPLEDGSTYLRWKGLSEFLVSPDGTRVTICPASRASQAAVHTYLLGQVLSFALLKKGIESLHATVVVVDGNAVGFLGDCGIGKSTLAASFLQLGYRMLTDDVLVVRQQGKTLLAFPGPARIKLFPGTAKSLLEHGGAGVPMNQRTSKLVIRLHKNQIEESPVPLRALYVLPTYMGAARSRSIRIRELSQSRACVELLKSTFNNSVLDPWRLQQQFEAAAAHAPLVAVKKMSYPRTLAHLPRVRSAILSDLARVLNGV